MKKIKNLINNKTFLMEEPSKEDLVTSCMDVYKVNIQCDGIIDRLKLITMVRGVFKIKR